jgi:hypothetical protein
MDERRRSLLRTTSALLLIAQVAGTVPALAATAPAKPATAPATAAKGTGLVPKAQAYYRDARYDEAVGLLAGPILRKELAGDELREARLVMARCYVKKGMTPRAKEYFGAVVTADPAYVPEKGKLDDEEMAVFNSVKGVSAPQAAVPPPAKTPDGKTPPAATTPAQPEMHKPDVAAAGSSQPSWLSRNKYLALGAVVVGGVAIGLAASSGGGDSSPTPGPTSLPGFPAVPGGH